MKCQGWRMTILGIGQNQGKNATVSKNKKNQWWPFGSKKVSNSILMLFGTLANSSSKIGFCFLSFFSTNFVTTSIYLEVIKLLQCTNLKKKSWFPILCLTFFSYHEIFLVLVYDIWWQTFLSFFLKGKRGLFLVKVHTYRKVKITFVTKEESARKWGTDKKALLWPKSDQKVQNGQKTL